MTVTRSIAFLAAGSVGAAALTRSSTETPVSLWVRVRHHSCSVTVNVVCGIAPSCASEEVAGAVTAPPTLTLAACRPGKAAAAAAFSPAHPAATAAATNHLHM